MRAKIIADIAIVLFFTGLWLLWVITMPLPPKESVKTGEVISIISTMEATMLVTLYFVVKTIQWIHKGK
jgi:hypothetical protein